MPEREDAANDRVILQKSYPRILWSTWADGMSAQRRMAGVQANSGLDAEQQGAKGREGVDPDDILSKESYLILEGGVCSPVAR
nr:hypothetical protein CFP56_00364 [Quercus suber]